MATQKQVFTEAHENIDKANHTTSGLIEYLRYIFGKLENASGGGGGGSEVSYTQTLASGTETGTIEIDGVSTKMYAPTPAAPTEVEVTQVISTGTKIATISVDDVPTDIYAPAGGGSGEYIEVIGDGTKTRSQILDALHALIDPLKITKDTTFINNYNVGAGDFMRIGSSASGTYYFGKCDVIGTEGYLSGVVVKSSGSTYGSAVITTHSATDQSSVVDPSGRVYRIYY